MGVGLFYCLTLPVFCHYKIVHYHHVMKGSKQLVKYVYFSSACLHSHMTKKDTATPMTLTVL